MGGSSRYYGNHTLCLEWIQVRMFCTTILFRPTYQWIAMMKTIIIDAQYVCHEINWLAHYEGLKVVLNPSRYDGYLTIVSRTSAIPG